MIQLDGIQSQSHQGRIMGLVAQVVNLLRNRYWQASQMSPASVPVKQTLISSIWGVADIYTQCLFDYIQFKGSEEATLGVQQGEHLPPEITVNRILLSAMLLTPTNSGSGGDEQNSTSEVTYCCWSGGETAFKDQSNSLGFASLPSTCTTPIQCVIPVMKLELICIEGRQFHGSPGSPWLQHPPDLSR